MTEPRRAMESRDISALFGVLRRRGWIMMLCALVAAGTAYLYSSRQDATYRASASLLLREAPLAPTGLAVGTPTPNSAPDREALVLSEQVKARAVKQLESKRGAGAGAAVAEATALSAAESKVVKITATASSGATAALVANTIAEQNIAYRRASSRGRILRARRVAQRSLRELGPPGT